MKKIIFCLAILFQFAVSGTASAESAAIKRTLADLRGVTGPFTFAVLGDNRSGDRIYGKIIHQMMARNPLFAINTGDIIPHAGDREEWANFKKISEKITVPYFLTPGNHDIDDHESEDVWRDEVDLPGLETYYSFTVGKNLFVILNSCEPKKDRRIEGMQFEWLKKILDPDKYDHQFVFLHHPLFLPKNSTYEGKSLDRYPGLRDGLHGLFVERRVDAVFAGHEHTFRRAQKDGVTYIITGGAGAPLYGRESYNNVLIIKVDGPHIGTKVIDRDGMLRDEFTLQK